MNQQQVSTTASHRRPARHVLHAAAALVGALACAPLPAQGPPEVADDLPAALPDIRRMNGVDYLSGGIGLNESRAIRAESLRWPLQITMAELNQGKAVWIADAEIRIRNARNRPVLEFRSGGPLALVRLDPGKYTVEARFSGVTQKRDVIIVSGTPRKITIVWKIELR